MNNINEVFLAKGIYYNKKTKLCIFQTDQDELKWFNVHIDNIEGKFYPGCLAKLYLYDSEILKAIIVKPDKKKRTNKFFKNKIFRMIFLFFKTYILRKIENNLSKNSKTAKNIHKFT